MDLKRKKTLAALIGVLVVVYGIWWWQHDPFHGIGRYVVSDQTIYYKVTKPLFDTPRRARSLFLANVSMDKLLAQTRANYSEKDGWQYTMDGMPLGFKVIKPTSGGQLPETITASDDRDGKLLLIETRIMSSSEVQLVKRSLGSHAFIAYPLAPPIRRRDNTLDQTRFAIPN